MRIADIQQRLQALGAKPVHLQRVLRHWTHALPHTQNRRQPEHWLPRAVRDDLPALDAELAALVRLQSRHPAADGSERLLLALADGQTVEAVLLQPPGRSDRHNQGLCVSSQVGCAVGCPFCMTGVGGLLRQLGSAEIVAQVALARRLRPVHKVVFMGMGEPAHNLDNVMEAIQLLGTVGQIGHKNLVFSTVGDPRAFARLLALAKGEVRPALALSLHTSDAALRERLLPRAPRLTPAELVDQAEAYARASGYPVQYQWTLLEGVNDSDAELDGITRLLAGKFGVLNLIPWNSVPGLHFQRPSWARAAEMARLLHRRGILTKLRQSAGQDVEAGCGQLRARAAAAPDGAVVVAPPARRIRPAAETPAAAG
jgi:23S rRNA (adenine2503-C2)-methyltransferase